MQEKSSETVASCILEKMEGDNMLRSCAYCGRIHDTNIDCGKKPKKNWRRTYKDKYRSTSEWQRIRAAVRERDKNLCQICIRNLYGTIERFNYKGLSVHHCIPIEQDENKRDDRMNLLTLCERHHEMAESGAIPLELVLGIVMEQEEKAKRE